MYLNDGFIAKNEVGQDKNYHSYADFLRIKILLDKRTLS